VHRRPPAAHDTRKERKIKEKEKKKKENEIFAKNANDT
jgi:hypothetical protein